jgi:hypothetical protein
MVLFGIDESCRDVYCVGSKVRYVICLVSFFRFEWVYIFHDCVIICLKKEWCQRQTVRVMVTTTFYLQLVAFSLWNGILWTWISRECLFFSIRDDLIRSQTGRYSKMKWLVTHHFVWKTLTKISDESNNIVLGFSYGWTISFLDFRAH